MSTEAKIITSAIAAGLIFLGGVALGVYIGNSPSKNKVSEDVVSRQEMNNLNQNLTIAFSNVTSRLNFLEGSMRNVGGILQIFDNGLGHHEKAISNLISQVECISNLTYRADSIKKKK